MLYINQLITLSLLLYLSFFSNNYNLLAAIIINNIKNIQKLLLFCHMEIYQFNNLLILFPICQLKIVNLVKILKSILLGNINLQIKIIKSINNR